MCLPRVAPAKAHSHGAVEVLDNRRASGRRTGGWPWPGRLVLRLRFWSRSAAFLQRGAAVVAENQRGSQRLLKEFLLALS